MHDICRNVSAKTSTLFVFDFVTPNFYFQMIQKLPSRCLHKTQSPNDSRSERCRAKRRLRMLLPKAKLMPVLRTEVRQRHSIPCNTKGISKLSKIKSRKTKHWLVSFNSDCQLCVHRLDKFALSNYANPLTHNPNHLIPKSLRPYRKVHNPRSLL